MFKPYKSVIKAFRQTRIKIPTARNHATHELQIQFEASRLRVKRLPWGASALMCQAVENGVACHPRVSARAEIAEELE